MLNKTKPFNSDFARIFCTNITQNKTQDMNIENIGSESMWFISDYP